MRPARFNRVLDAANRLPRPAFAFGALALFGFAMAAPDSFAARMTALSTIPEPLWWLLGGVVSFHFGAREAHYHRTRDTAGILPPEAADAADAGMAGMDAPNPALAAMRAARS